jgi:uncharacterized protein YidB (DUF937 family)
MGLMDLVTQAAAQYGGGGEHGQVAGGLMQEIESQGGIGTVFSAFQNNGLGGLVQQWAGGQTAPAAPAQVEQGLGGTGIIDGIATRTGMSPAMVKMALAVLLPMVIHHFTSSGHVDQQGVATGQPAPEAGGLLQSILGKLTA